MELYLPLSLTIILILLHGRIAAGQQQDQQLQEFQQQPQQPISETPHEPQFNEILINSKTIMDSVFLTIIDNLNAMDHMQHSLASSLNMTYQSLPSRGIANREVGYSIENFKRVMEQLSVDLMSSCDNLKMRIEALRMGMQTGQETLDQAFMKMQNMAKCTLKQLFVIVNQIRNCTFRALTACKSEVAIIQDGISDAFLEIHNINMRAAHCSLMNPKNSVPCIDVLTNEAPEIIENAQNDLPSQKDVTKVLDGINRCSAKILQNVDTACEK